MVRFIPRRGFLRWKRPSLTNQPPAFSIARILGHRSPFLKTRQNSTARHSYAHDTLSSEALGYQ